MANWIELAVGVWVLISPWLLGFSGISLMKWGNLIAGLIIVLVNVWILFGEKHMQTKVENVSTKVK